MPILQQFQDRARRAAAIMAAHGDHTTAASCLQLAGLDSHTRPGAQPVVKSGEQRPANDRQSPHVATWHEAVPTTPGTYWWRRDAAWEPIQRTLPSNGRIYSQRYCQEVPAQALGGQWLY